MINAMDNGNIRRGTVQRLTSEARASRNVTIRMAEADLNLARKQAQEKGLPYQTCEVLALPAADRICRYDVTTEGLVGV